MNNTEWHGLSKVGGQGLHTGFQTPEFGNQAVKKTGHPLRAVQKGPSQKMIPCHALGANQRKRPPNYEQHMRAYESQRGHVAPQEGRRDLRIKLNSQPGYSAVLSGPDAYEVLTGDLPEGVNFNSRCQPGLLASGRYASSTHADPYVSRGYCPPQRDQYHSSIQYSTPQANGRNIGSTPSNNWVHYDSNFDQGSYVTAGHRSGDLTWAPMFQSPEISERSSENVFLPRKDEHIPRCSRDQSGHSGRDGFDSVQKQRCHTYEPGNVGAVTERQCIRPNDRRRDEPKINSMFSRMSESPVTADPLSEQRKSVELKFKELMDARGCPEVFNELVSFSKAGLKALLDLHASLAVDFPLAGQLIPLNKIVTTVVMGGQSVGKSSLMAALSGNRSDISDGETSTKQPIIYHFKHGKAYYAEAKRQNNRDEFSEALSFYSPEALSEYLVESQKRIPGVLSSDRLYVTIYGPQFLEKRIVDFPGDIADHTDAEAAIRQKHYDYFDTPYNIFIRVVKGTNDIQGDAKLGEFFVQKASNHPYRLIVQTYGEDLVKRQVNLASSQPGRMLGVFDRAYYEANGEKTPIFCPDTSPATVDAICKTTIKERGAAWDQVDSVFYNNIITALGRGHNAQQYPRNAFSLKALSDSTDYLYCRIVALQIGDIGNRVVPELLTTYHENLKTVMSQSLFVHETSKNTSKVHLDSKAFVSKYQGSKAFTQAIEGFRSEGELMQGALRVAEVSLRNSDPQTKHEVEQISQLLSELELASNDALGSDASPDNFASVSLDDRRMPAEAQGKLKSLSLSFGEMLEMMNDFLPRHALALTCFSNYDNPEPAINIPNLVADITLTRYPQLVDLAEKKLLSLLTSILRDVSSQESAIYQSFLQMGFDRHSFQKMIKKVHNQAVKYMKSDLTALLEQRTALKGIYSGEVYLSIKKQYVELFECAAAADPNRPPELSVSYLSHLIKVNKEKVFLSAKLAGIATVASGGVVFLGSLLAPVAAGVAGVAGAAAMAGGKSVPVGALLRGGQKIAGKAASGANSVRKAVVARYAKANEIDAARKASVNDRALAIRENLGLQACSQAEQLQMDQDYFNFQDSEEDIPPSGNAIPYQTLQLVEVVAKVEYELREQFEDVGVRVFDQLAPGLFRVIAKDLEKELDLHVENLRWDSENPKSFINQLNHIKSVLRELGVIQDKIAKVQQYL